MIQDKQTSIRQPSIAVAMQPAGSKSNAGTMPTPARPVC
jgi:hypothetical protein